MQGKQNNIELSKDSSIFIAGHKGLVGSTVVKNFNSKGFNNLILRTRNEVDLLNQSQVNTFFEKENIDYVILAAAKVGGILYNQEYQADFLYENLTIASNVIHSSYQNDVKKLLYLGSSCIYPKLAKQPITEDCLLTGKLEPTNEGYALAKIAGVKLCEKYNLQYGCNFVSAMPTNLYGPGDNFHPSHSHVIPGLLNRFHKAKLNNEARVSIWGSGEPKREFMHVEDLAEAIFYVLKNYRETSPINLGSGDECSIAELAMMIKEVTDFKGGIVFDSTKPDGTMRKILDSSRIRDLGWSPKYKIKEGLEKTYRWALENKALDN